jgi:hypothetical protein
VPRTGTNGSESGRPKNIRSGWIHSIENTAVSFLVKLFFSWLIEKRILVYIFKPRRLSVFYRKYTKSVGESKKMMTRIQNLNDELQTVPESDRKT